LQIKILNDTCALRPPVADADEALYASRILKVHPRAVDLELLMNLPRKPGLQPALALLCSTTVPLVVRNYASFDALCMESEYMLLLLWHVRVLVFGAQGSTNHGGYTSSWWRGWDPSDHPRHSGSTLRPVQVTQAVRKAFDIFPNLERVEVMVQQSVVVQTPVGVFVRVWTRGGPGGQVVVSGCKL
jgi:hypothetical protein